MEIQEHQPQIDADYKWDSYIDGIFYTITTISATGILLRENDTVLKILISMFLMFVGTLIFSLVFAKLEQILNVENNSRLSLANVNYSKTF